VAARLQAQNSKTYYQKKLVDEQGKVGGVEEAARVLQEECMVRFYLSWSVELCVMFKRGRRIGLPRPRSTANALRTHESRKKYSGTLIPCRRH
jgi:hypothetical protein